MSRRPKTDIFSDIQMADKLSAYIKCIEEVKYFIKNVLPKYELTLDELE